MIQGIGCDIAKVDRFKKGEAFLISFVKKNFTISEINELEKRKKTQNEDFLSLAVATRFSAKEAVSKALGSGFSQGVSLKDIEIIHDELGCPRVNLYNKAKERAIAITSNGNYQIHITISNEKEYVSTFAIIENI